MDKPFRSAEEQVDILESRGLKIADREDAVRRIKDGIWFRGPNVWILAFAIVLVGISVGALLLAKLLTKLFEVAMLGWLNKLLGVAFGLLVTALILGVVIVLFDTVNIRFGLVKGDILDNSLLYGAVKDFAYFVFPYLKELLLKQ